MQISQTQIRALGVLLLAIGIVINPWTVGYLLTDDGTIQQINIIAIISLFDWTFVLGGLQLLWRWVERVAWDEYGHRPSCGGCGDVRGNRDIRVLLGYRDV